MRRMLVAAAIAAGLIATPSADAAIGQVFTKTAAPLSCTVQAGGQRFCSGSITSWDGIPLDVNVGFPPEAGADASWPVIGLYHGWGGSKLALTGADAQRALTRGYAVFTMTDRGWGNSCGAAMRTNPLCVGKGYIHLMHNGYEVRDAQYALGQLADDGVIDPARIGATGGSYGGAMSIALGALRNRTVAGGALVPWTSPLGKPMSIAATVPEFTWSDIAYSLTPNGSNLDYLANASYLFGGHRVGVQKQSWNNSLYLAGQVLGYYAPIGSDPAADITGWKALTDSGGPFDANPAAAQMVAELTANHSAYYLDDSIAPAPALLANGFNDDLFGVDESLRYYNKVRAKYPAAPISMFHLDFGHNPRAGSISAADRAALTAAENAWLDYYVKGVGTEPADARGGVDVLTSKCPVSGAGSRYHAASWALLAPGEIRIAGAAPQTITAPGAAPSSAFTSGDVCATTASADNASAATYKVPAATSAYTLAGSPTIVAKLTTPGVNDMVAARLYDVDGATQRLIARGVQRPLNPGGGPTEQVFQLHPQAWTVQPGHVLKLELLAQDAQYLRTPTGQQSVTVSDLQLRLPVVDAPGKDLGGLTVASPAAKIVPPGGKLARDYATDAPGTVGGSVPATLSLTLGPAASFGAFTPGVDRDYTATTSATVISTAADAALAVSDPGRLTNGAFALDEPLRVEIAPAAWTGPVSNATATITFRQHIGAGEPLRTGSYARTLTFTLSTTNP
jgi:acetyl xylan esterase AXE1/X-Pro dipeptidyl-peptidase-like protein